MTPALRSGQALAVRRRAAGEAVVICLDEFGPLEIQPQPGGKAWAPGAKPKRIRATSTCPHGVRHLLSAYVA